MIPRVGEQASGKEKDVDNSYEKKGIYRIIGIIGSHFLLGSFSQA